MGAVDLNVAVVADDEDAGAFEVAREVDQEVEGAAVGPMEVFEDDEQRLHG